MTDDKNNLYNPNQTGNPVFATYIEEQKIRLESEMTINSYDLCDDFTRPYRFPG